MVSPHISLTDEIDQKVRKYCKNNNLNYSQGIRKLIETGLDTKDTNKKLDLNNSLLENIFSKQIYIRDFLEQFYSDMEIEKLSNPKNNKALQKYKLEKYRDEFND